MLGNTCLAVAEELSGSKFGLIGELNQAGLFDTVAISNPGWDACKIPEGLTSLVIRDMPIRGVDISIMREGISRIVNGEEAIRMHPDHVKTPEGHPPVTSFLGVPLRQARPSA
ncbi:MAG: sensory transduction histidine kinase [Candidatus Brocadiaceae bacterium]|nr:sensory transduction histidine kinase [Candidatus Brocadiaceae bacterium]